MARKSMDRLNGFDSRQAIWDEIRRHRDGFTVRDLHLGTTMKLDSVREYVTGLVNAGYVAPQEELRGQNSKDGRQIDFREKDCEKKSVPSVPFKTPATIYKLVKDAGVDAPRVRKDGTLVTQGQGNINMWRTMRILGVFSARELAVTASTETCVVAVTTAEKYLRHLCDAGYLQQVKELYRFKPSMHTGPKPPMIQRVKRVWDQNLKKVMWSEDHPPAPNLDQLGTELNSVPKTTRQEGGGDYDQQ